MAASVPHKVDGVPRKTLGFKGESVSYRGEGHHKKLVASDEAKRCAEKIVERAIYHTGLQKKEAAAELGYFDAKGEPDQTPISRWIAGLEPAPLAKFVASEILCAGLSIALAEHTRKAEIQTVISMRRMA